MRALFQILMGVATVSTVASTTSAIIQGEGGSRKKMRSTPKRMPSVCRRISSAMGAASRTSCQLGSSLRTIDQM
ncbi:hypothetical protein D3C83_28420 [compost metagenome]